MKTHLVVNDTDLTAYIVAGSYNIDSADQYESWKDGNFKEHRIIVTNKVSGSFEIACSNRTGSITLADFLETWNGAVDNGVVTLGLYIPTRDKFEALEAYYDIKVKDHILSGDGNFIDVLTIELQER